MAPSIVPVSLLSRSSSEISESTVGSHSEHEQLRIPSSSNEEGRSGVGGFLGRGGGGACRAHMVSEPYSSCWIH